MQIWNLSEGDPLHLTLSADPRLGPTDYANDVTWELSLRGEDPPALALFTTFGLRARRMQFFPVFSRGGQSVIDPAAFHRAPKVTRIYPNYLEVHFAPFEGIEVRAEYCVVGSQVVAGRLHLVNQSVLPHNLRLDWAGVLNPLGSGEGMAVLPTGLGLAMQGRSDGLAVVCFLTGGAQAGKSAYPALSLLYELYPGSHAETAWAVAARPGTEEAFQMAQEAANRLWEAELARIELCNAADVVEISSGEPEWDAALALGQRAALGLRMANPSQLPAPSFVLTRRIDQGASARGDGSDHPYLWAGQTAFDSWYLSVLLPGMTSLEKDLLRNFLASAQDARLDFRPGLGGQRTRSLAQPLLAEMVLRLAPPALLEEAYPALLQHFKAWLSAERDADGDGLPEWEHPLQSALESSPMIDRWSASAQGLDTAWVESPALGAMLYREALALEKVNRRLGWSADLPWLRTQAERIRRAVEETWDKRARIYRYRDAQTHLSRAGKALGTFKGAGVFTVQRQPAALTRLIIQVEAASESTRAVVGLISGLDEAGQRIEEPFAPRDFTWSLGRARATTRQVFSRVNQIEVNGVMPEDRVRLVCPDFTLEDLSLFLPLWAGIPEPSRARLLVEKRLLKDFLQPFGLPVCPPARCPAEPVELACVALPWNVLIGEGLLAAGFRQEAADLLERLMGAVVGNLKRERGFRQYYHAVSGLGVGERNHLWGMPPLGFFLRVIGLELLSPSEIVVGGFNPFPWPITVKYQRIKITREGDRTTLTLAGRPPLVITGQDVQRISLP
uniref:Mannosylglycerate hydrolase MGH1-like glycoside hydrolase domain-containing protein n=1 Tax=Anaerolinea thermolimosa TaxID=229919 RepID=A0A7C4PM47_9CHLR